MVDENLLNDLKEMREEGLSAPSDVLKLFAVAKQLASESEDLKEEIEEIDSLNFQFIMTNPDYKWWVKMGEGAFEYGKGETDEPSITMAASQENWLDMLNGEIDAINLNKEEDLTIKGNLQDVLAFSEVLMLMEEELEDL